MSEDFKDIPEPPTDTVSGIGTVKMDIDGLDNPSPTETGGPLKIENLEIDAKSILSTLTRKPPEKYKFRKSIGQGGMKVVIQVKDRDTTRDIAMAILPDAQSRPKREIIRFIEEARITASLEHPNIVPVHDIGVDSNGSPYFTMKLIKGETLAAVLRKLHDGDPEYLENYTLDKLLLIYVKICNGIAFAHSKGVLHLDLKPENIQVGDFGEVIIMDWGLAKVITDTAELPVEETAEPKQPYVPGSTQDGVRKGTPGYMSPEQAAGKNSEKDFRTDVYALGAILYTMLTCENPLHGEDVSELIRETVQGDIIPPSKRVTGKLIPSGLEAVVMKAMAVQPEDRYKGAKELRNEVLAFMSGYATRAERATPLKKTLLFVNRHKITVISAAIALILILGTGFYALREISRQHGDWIPAFQRDFTHPEANLEGLVFYDSSNAAPVPVWSLTATGLTMKRGQWMWLSNARIKENVRIVVKLLPSQSGNLLQLAMNAKPAQLSGPRDLHPGYTLQTSGYRGAMDLILKRDSKAPEIIAASPAQLTSGGINTIVFQRDGENILFSINGKKQEATDLFPLAGREFSGIGLRAFGSGNILCSIEVYRLALPVKASPVIAGDALLETRYFDDAIDKYLTIADDYIRGPIAEHALAKAYATAANFIQNEEKRSKILIGIKRRIAARFSAFSYHEKLLEIDAVMLWKNKNYSASLSIIGDIFRKNPNTGIMKNILQLPHSPLPDYVLPDFLMNIARTKDLTRLNLSGYGIRNLAPLANMRLIYLDCSNNRLTSLNGIEGMPLEILICGNNGISSLEPLNGIALKTLYCEGNPLETLRGPDLSELIDVNCSQTNLETLASLRGASLERLLCRDNRISDLSPLSGMPLTHLDAGMNPVSSLDSLKNMPLEVLLLDGTNIADLSPLRGMPLILLNIWQCRRLSDFSLLTDLDTLEILSVPENAEFKRPPNLQNCLHEPGLPFGKKPAFRSVRKKK